VALNIFIQPQNNCICVYLSVFWFTNQEWGSAGKDSDGQASTQTEEALRTHIE
jgi:hypothetical protein